MKKFILSLVLVLSITTGYTTETKSRCRDGNYSTSSGGSCSSHGGVVQSY